MVGSSNMVDISPIKRREKVSKEIHFSDKVNPTLEWAKRRSSEVFGKFVINLI